MTSIRRRTRLADVGYAHTYAAELQDQLLSAQIRVLRESRDWSQAELAERAKMAQERISLFESGEYSGYSLSTLRKLARAFDVGLQVAFASYVDTLRRMERSDPDSLRVRSRADELNEPERVALVESVKWSGRPIEAHITMTNQAQVQASHG
jgi:transcriptional regulator with XRE-family HTH domain